MTHKELIESAASYALDALDHEERATFEAHLAGCEECQSEVAAYREVAGVLAHAVPRRAIPRSDALRDRILREARQVRPIATAPRPAVVAPIPVKPRGRVAPWLLAAAAVIAAVGLEFMYRGERQQAADLRSKLATAQATLARDDSTLAAFLGPEVHVVSLTAAADQKPSVRVFWNHSAPVHRHCVEPATGSPGEDVSAVGTA
jgi:anti-sigma factor RsiW